MTAGRLTVGPAGRITGPATITYNTPWPCRNGTYGSGRMMGTIMHTMVGNLPGTIAVFNNPDYQASAHFGIDQSGLIHQFGPVGAGWCAWAQESGNETWYSIEHADDGNPDIPLTAAQMTASAQLLECLSAFAGFPLQVTNSTGVMGYGVHNMGGAAWGGHSCPDLPPAHVRSAQRAAIILEAHHIRDGAPFPSAPPAPRPGAAPVPAAPAPVKEIEMLIVQVNKTQVPKGTTWPGVFLLAADGTLHHIATTDDVDGYKAAGVPGPVTISWWEYQARTAA